MNVAADDFVTVVLQHPRDRAAPGCRLPNAMRNLLYAQQRFRSDGGSLLEIESAFGERVWLHLTRMIEGHGSGLGDRIECCPQRPRWPAMGIATKRASDCFDVGAILQRD